MLVISAMNPLKHLIDLVLKSKEETATSLIMLVVVMAVVRIQRNYQISNEIKSMLLLLALFVGSTLLIYSTIRYQFLDVRIIFRQSFVYSITSAMLVGLYILLVYNAKDILVPVFGDNADIISYVFIKSLMLSLQIILQ